jgi:hypothetical protein
VSSTPAETQIERQVRLDYEAAEKAYRDSMAEQDRQSKLGTAKATDALTSTSTGNYLRFALDALGEIRDAGWRAKGDTEIAGVARKGWQTDRVLLLGCEDSSRIRFVDREGKDVTPTGVTRTYVQDLTVTKHNGTWKLSDIESKPIKSFKGQPCAA